MAATIIGLKSGSLKACFRLSVAGDGGGWDRH
jgi:hypothetical protein